MVKNFLTPDHSLTSLKVKMSAAKSVEEWNALREEAKTEFSTNVINRLDVSGYINVVLLRKKSNNE